MQGMDGLQIEPVKGRSGGHEAKVITKAAGTRLDIFCDVCTMSDDQGFPTITHVRGSRRFRIA